MNKETRESVEMAARKFLGSVAHNSDGNPDAGDIYKWEQQIFIAGAEAHAALVERDKFSCCGGNDDTPKDHCMDCPDHAPKGATWAERCQAFDDVDALPIAKYEELEKSYSRLADRLLIFKTNFTRANSEIASLRANLKLAEDSGKFSESQWKMWEQKATSLRAELERVRGVCAEINREKNAFYSQSCTNRTERDAALAEVERLKANSAFPGGDALSYVELAEMLKKTQAEVDHKETARLEFKNLKDAMFKSLKSAELREQGLREAINFYGDRRNWNGGVIHDNDLEPQSQCGGRLARQTLADKK